MAGLWQASPGGQQWLLVLLALRYLLPTGKHFLLVLDPWGRGNTGAQGPQLILGWPRVSTTLGLPFYLGLHPAIPSSMFSNVTQRDYLPPLLPFCLTWLLFTCLSFSLLACEPHKGSDTVLFIDVSPLPGMVPVTQ